MAVHVNSARLGLKTLTIALASTITLAGCASHSSTSSSTAPLPQNDGFNATLWMQTAPEYQANVRAVYDLATLRLDQALADKTWTALPDMQDVNYEALPPAIILDCDETVLDNSAYQAFLVKTGQSYNSTTWTQFVQDQVSKALPGAVEFTQYAAKKGVTVFYVTNRKKANEDATFKNMVKLGFPMGNGLVDTLFTKGEKPEWTSKKGNRDAEIAKQYRVLLMLGDNFGDFTDDASGSVAQRAMSAQRNAAHWGKDWLMLPNPAYGSFISATFNNQWSLPAAERRQKELDAMTPWMPAAK